MIDQIEKAEIFSRLHVPGEPLILFNAWDGGSAKTITECGAKAIAMGDHPVSFAHGYNGDNFADFSFEAYANTIREVYAVIGDTPLSIDVGNGEGISHNELLDHIRTLVELGVAGINFEDRLPDSSDVLPVADQALKLNDIRQLADKAGVPLFINARTDLFTTHEAAEFDQLLESIDARIKAYKEAGGNGLFAPGLTDLNQIKRLCEVSVLPVNIIKLPGTPSIAELAGVGVARISYGPIAYFRMTEWLKGEATKVLNRND